LREEQYTIFTTHTQKLYKIHKMKHKMQCICSQNSHNEHYTAENNKKNTKLDSSWTHQATCRWLGTSAYKARQL